MPMLPMVLISLDGWGHSRNREGNAIAACGARNMESLAARFPGGLLEASGLAVGLPAGQMGNSEVGHMCMGAGRIVLQDLLRISRAIQTREIWDNPVLRAAIDPLAQTGAALHLLGLTSDGGVHSHIDHARGIVRMARDRGVTRIFWHAFLDGRDTPPRCAMRYIEELESFFASERAGRFATVSGRYYAMDRDNRWDRTRLAYRAMTEAEGPHAGDAAAALRAAYARGEDDEFVKPTVIAPGTAGGNDASDGRVRDGDAIVFFNFRADRARQMTRAFTRDDFDRFERAARPKLSSYVCMTRYDETFDLPVAFPPARPDRVLGQVLSDAGLRQLRIAETEKYAHVTFFFNGGEEKSFPGEERILIPSPPVATYDLMPEMSAGEVTEALLARLAAGAGDLVVILNYANADMVGHTGVYEATVKACRFIDGCVGRVAARVLELGGSLIVTADHGNAEQMIDPKSGGPHTAHTLNPVPILVASESLRPGIRIRTGGTLADVAPTMLELLNLAQPAEMTGRSLLEPA
ncbi:MAG TPA: 2,3-bisphosphoglycerate-independent phosphoglycerate mutase [Candidatus Polarisedimenticolia bacterium]|nr:2,3-bisphosphoglycerate-independent phosphoglycerate mutase [Candidatus Polarisedimenticolia bacterium]